MPTIAEAVIAEMLKEGARYTWFGEMDVWGSAYEKATGKRAHPMDAWQYVRNALSRSKRFRQDGFIRAASWSGREILHPRFVLVNQTVRAGRFEVSYDAHARTAMATDYMVVRIVEDTTDRTRVWRETIAGPLQKRIANARLYDLKATLIAQPPSESECEELVGAVCGGDD